MVQLCEQHEALKHLEASITFIYLHPLQIPRISRSVNVSVTAPLAAFEDAVFKVVNPDEEFLDKLSPRVGY